MYKRQSTHCAATTDRLVAVQLTLCVEGAETERGKGREIETQEREKCCFEEGWGGGKYILSLDAKEGGILFLLYTSTRTTMQFESDILAPFSLFFIHASGFL